MMLSIIVLWLTFGLLSFGLLGLDYIRARSAARGPWKLRKDRNYVPTVSIIVPTYNEYEVIGYKIRNLANLKYPKNLTEIVFIDSHSTDFTVNVIREFAENHPDMNITILVENERKGKSPALNKALESCSGDVVIVSDADCFWPPLILSESLCYLADPTVGAITGPKRLLNPESSWVTRNENRYLNSMNLLKLGESKESSTILFEGGFSAYKKETLDSFDPYKTGSDDCGTVIRLLEKSFRAIMVPEAEFFTTFPETWKGRLEIKTRRANQMVRLFRMYIVLLFRNKIKVARKIVSRNLIVYLLCPVMCFFFLIASGYLILKAPLTSLLLLTFAIPKIRGHLIEVSSNYLIMLNSMISAVLGREFLVWNRPQDRALLTETMLLQKGLI